MARKQIVFVIVEGPSDAEALDAIISKIFDKDAVYVHIIHGDITSERGVTSANIVGKIGNEVRAFAKSNHYKSSDFKAILHIVDTDGAYIPDANVIEDKTVKSPMYSLTEIRAFDKHNIENRNAQKKTNLDKLCYTNEIWNVQYRIYYMSCNLDHVLYDKLNSSDEEKENDALHFALQYKAKIPEFLKFISESDFAVIGGYRESWDYIRCDLHSLERHTNIALCFQKHE